MLESYLRPNFQFLLVDPLVRRLSYRLVSANAITLLAGSFGIAVAVLLYYSAPWWALACLWVSGYLDALDGTIARMQQTSSAIGTVLDICVDRLVEFAVIYGLFLVQPNSRGNACLLMLGSVLLCITSFLVVGIFQENESEKGFHYSPGLMERLEAFVFFSAMILFPSQFYWLAYSFTALVTLTALLRLKQFSHYSR